jgi:phosphomannomutase
MTNELLQLAQDWIAADPDAITRRELEELVEARDMSAIADRMNGRLEFGTAGLRGILGAGPTRMNSLVVRRASAGLATYMRQQFAEVARPSIIVGHDARLRSDDFARQAALVFAAAGIKVYFFQCLAATPLVAWAVNRFATEAGVMVTASHNPPEYNGYKVYWNTGGQIVPPHDTGIAAAIEAVPLDTIATADWDRAVAQGHIELLGDDVAQQYLASVLALPLPADGDDRASLRIVYTAMHGVGAAFALRLFEHAGFPHVIPVPAQVEPDGTFPTVRFPNPEEPGALAMALELAQDREADIIIANDPDADRVAVAARDDEGTLRVFTGDQIGALLGDFLLRQSEGDRAVGTTIVSSRMLAAIAQSHGASCFETLTGFKWIADRAIALQKEGIAFVFGYEEAIGYTVGDLVRDKDGISAALAVATLAARLHDHGLSLWDALDALYMEHGVYLTGQRSISLTANAGPLPGQRLRDTPPTTIGGIPVVRTIDLKFGTDTNNDPNMLALPKSDVLIYHLHDRSRVIVRPSGTEPKVKVYYEVIEPVDAHESIDDARQFAAQRLAGLMAVDI